MPGQPSAVLRVALLLGPVLLLIAGAAMGALGVHSTTDIWIGLAAGRYILSHAEVAIADPFSYTFAGEPFLNQNWLSHVAFFWVYDRIAPWAVLGLTWLLNAAVYGLVLYAARVRSRSWMAALIATGLIALACRHYLNPRPVTLGYTCLAATCAVLNYLSLAGGRQRWWPALLLLPVLAVWGNAHGSFVFGYGIIALFVACWALTRWLKRLVVPASGRQVVALCAVAVVALLLTLLLGPFGLANLTHPFVVGESEVFRSVSEWRPPWEQIRLGLPVWPLWTSLGVAVVVLVVAAAVGWLGRRADGPAGSSGDPSPRVTIFDLLLIALGLYMALWARRFAPLFYILATPAVVALIARAGWSASSRSKHWGRIVLATTAVLAAAVAGTYTYQRASFDLVEKYANQPEYNLLQRFVVYERSPVHALEFLRRNGMEANLLCEMEFAGPAMFEAPQVKVFIDGRLQQLYTEEHYLKYLALFQADGPDAPAIRDVLDDARTDAVLLRRRARRSQPLLAAVGGDDSWRNVLCTSAYALFLRHGSPALDRIAQLERAEQAWWPPFPESLSTRGILWMQTQPPDPERALRYMRAAIEQDPVVGLWCYGVMKDAWRALGRGAEAVKFFQQEEVRINDPALPVSPEDRELLREALDHFTQSSKLPTIRILP